MKNKFGKISVITCSLLMLSLINIGHSAFTTRKHTNDENSGAPDNNTIPKILQETVWRGSIQSQNPDADIKQRHTQNLTIHFRGGMQSGLRKVTHIGHAGSYWRIDHIDENKKIAANTRGGLTVTEEKINVNGQIVDAFRINLYQSSNPKAEDTKGPLMMEIMITLDQIKLGNAYLFTINYKNYNSTGGFVRFVQGIGPGNAHGLIIKKG